MAANFKHFGLFHREDSWVTERCLLQRVLSKLKKLAVVTSMNKRFPCLYELQWTGAIPCRCYSVPLYKRNTNLRVGDEIAPLYSPSCTLCNSCTLCDISSKPVPCSAVNSLCMDIRLHGVCASILVRISSLRTTPAQEGNSPDKFTTRNGYCCE